MNNENKAQEAAEEFYPINFTTKHPAIVQSLRNAFLAGVSWKETQGQASPIAAKEYPIKGLLPFNKEQALKGCNCCDGLGVQVKSIYEDKEGNLIATFIDDTIGYYSDGGTWYNKPELNKSRTTHKDIYDLYMMPKFNEGSNHYNLFKFFADAHGLTLLESEIEEIIDRVKQAPASPIAAAPVGLWEFAMYIRGKVLEGHTTNGQLKFWTEQWLSETSLPVSDAPVGEEKCAWCNGTGNDPYLDGDYTCHVCNGSGEKPSGRKNINS